MIPQLKIPKQLRQKSRIIDQTRVNLEYIADRKAAITKAVTESKKGDLVVVAGKGHDNYQKINGQNVPYEGDATIVQNLVKGL